MRVDIVDLPEVEWLRNISSNSYDYSISSALINHYLKNIINQKLDINAYSGTITLHPDGIRMLTYGDGGNGKEWVMAWSKTEYGQRFIGVCGSFSGTFDVVDLSEGKTDFGYYMPTPLYNLLDSLKTSFRANTRIAFGLPVQKKTF